jgi:tetratricopeptide (TPR) repeat protein
VNLLKSSARKRAEKLNDLANALADEGRKDEAVQCYHQAIEADAKWAVPWFNLGLIYKHSNRWTEALDCNERAVAIDPKHEGATWNLGIAATALNDWAKARAAWKSYGIDLSDGEGPIKEDFGLTPIRLKDNQDGEVVWCNRIDPARAIIDNIPFVESGHRYGDVVLHDGAPNGHRLSQGQEVPVFDELELLMPSEFGTYTITLENTDEVSTKELIFIFLTQDLSAENWETNIRWIGQACSEGKPYDLATGEHSHDEHTAASMNLVTLAVAATSEAQLNAILSPWLAKHPEVEMAELACLLEPALRH